MKEKIFISSERLKKFNEIFRKMWLLIILKVTKQTRFLSLYLSICLSIYLLSQENTFLEKQQRRGKGGEGWIYPSNFSRLLSVNKRTFCALFVYCLSYLFQLFSLWKVFFSVEIRFLGQGLTLLRNKLYWGSIF